MQIKIEFPFRFRTSSNDGMFQSRSFIFELTAGRRAYICLVLGAVIIELFLSVVSVMFFSVGVR